MKALGWIALAALVLLAFFALANWSVLTAPATINFLLFSVEGPLGIILLGVTLGFAALFAVYALSLRTSALVETRRHFRELQAQRELADNAEASRFTALTSQFDRQAERMIALVESVRADTQQRIDALETTLKSAITETANGLFANIGEIDDRLKRIVPAARGDGA